jgi:hypothetical protein
MHSPSQDELVDAPIHADQPQARCIRRAMGDARKAAATRSGRASSRAHYRLRFAIRTLAQVRNAAPRSSCAASRAAVQGTPAAGALCCAAAPLHATVRA